ncbi:MAG: CapA family protein, partial [Deltaproteobacteria bacterium]|nr:CapA family protein [Deltaproteobacteria bacterium]
MFRTVLSIALVLTACAGETDTGPEVDQLPQAEIELRDLFENTGISLAGMVVDPTGMPIAGARVAVDDRETTTDEAGTFRLDDLARHNDLVEVDADAYRPHLVPAWLFRAVEVEEVLLQPMVLTPEDPSTVRFLFGGDVAFGRRYLDTDESTPWDQLPPDDPEALIQVSDPEPGTRDVLASLRPLFGAADYAVVNLESVVTLDPDTPHPTKDYVFFSLPGSVEALDWVGVDFISLGNNHVYDYLEPGVADTLAFIEEAGFPHTGMGTDPDEAWTPRRVDLAGTPYAFIAATSVDGFRHDIGYVATADQGGAADLTDNEQLAATVTAEADAGNVPIALWHTGIEYTYSPSDYALGRMQRAVDAGAALVIAHHTHVAQGFGRYEGKLLAHSLGNLAFDQQRLETMLGLLVQVDMAGDEVLGAQAVPLVIEQYRTNLATGALSDGLLRRVAEFSQGLLVYPENDRAEVLAPSEPVDRVVEIAVEVPDSGVAVVDLRDLAVLGESLHAASGPALARPG